MASIVLFTPSSMSEVADTAKNAKLPTEVTAVRRYFLTQNACVSVHAEMTQLGQNATRQCQGSFVTA